MSEVKVALSQGGGGSGFGTKRKLMASGMPGKRNKGVRRSPALLRRKTSEIKTVDVASVAIEPVSGAATTTLLNGCVEGVDAVNRVGRRINMKSISLRMGITITEAPTTANPTYIRYALVYDRQPNGAAPAYSDIFQNITLAGATSSDAFSFPNPTNFDRFTILRDGFRVFRPFNDGLVNQPKQSLDNEQDAAEKWFVNLKGLEATYIAGAGAGTIADFRTGSLWFITTSNQTAANQPCQIVMSARLRFFDK